MWDCSAIRPAHCRLEADRSAEMMSAGTVEELIAFRRGIFNGGYHRGHRVESHLTRLIDGLASNKRIMVRSF
jgi:hypothetical protein